MQKKILKKVFDFYVIPFELVALSTRLYWGRIFLIGCQYVNKQSEGFRYYYRRMFWTDFLSEWSKNQTKIVRFRFKQCFGACNMLTAISALPPLFLAT